MESKRLSLEDFKAKAANINTNEVLEKIHGGDAEYCHGFWGQVAKKVEKVVHAIID